MRKLAVALVLTIMAAAAGLLLVGANSGPAIGIVLGLALIGGVVVVLGVSTERVALSLVGALVLTVTWNGIRVGGGAFGDVFMALGFVAVMAHVIADRRPLPLPPWLFAAGVGCFFSGLLTMVFPPSTDVIQRSVLTEASFKFQDGILGVTAAPGDLSTLIKYELSLVLIPVLIAAVGVTPQRCVRLLNLWTLGAVVNALVAIADFGGLHLTPIPISGNRSAGLTVQSNYLALTCVIALPTAMLWFGRSRRSTLAATLAVPVLLGGVYASGSRAGSVAAVLAVAGAVAVVPRLRAGLRITLPVAGMLLVILLMFTSTGTKILQQVRLGSSSSTSLSDSQRSTAAQTALDQIQARPLEGVGFSVITNAHDIYLELLDAGGIITFVAFLVFLAGLLTAALRARAGPLSDEAAVCALGVGVWLANGVFDNQLADKYLYVVPGLLFACSRARPASAAVAQPNGTLGGPRSQRVGPYATLAGAGAV